MSPLNITQPLGILVYNGYYKVMSNIPKMGHLMTHGQQVFLMVGASNKALAQIPPDFVVFLWGSCAIALAGSL